ncbi:hypothetical protein [Nostoc sp. WHI]|uniref:hypothetical protein n=1 Tax=Nostoc sp. WHI TaxID=2650611 RepID=UPI0018C72D44|nr:hypothetical protein [Nostoc sp. WHI]MBG1269934.1 hypothetical protein [Nostoc sp. WHI]
MSTQTIYRVLLNLPPINPQDPQGGQLFLEESTTDPDYQEGDSFKVTKIVGITTQTGLENQEFSFMVTVLERQVHYESNQKFVNIITESPDRTKIQAYAKALYHK